MKEYFILFSLLFSFLPVQAQYDAFTFQALILDENNNAVENSSVVIRATIAADSNLDEIYFQEQETLVTTKGGTIQYALGKGVAIVGSLADVDWLSGVPFVNVSYDRGDGLGWQEGYTTTFSIVPFCFESKYVVCQDGAQGETGAQGAQGPSGPPGPDGSPIPGQQGPAGPDGVPILEPLAEAPAMPEEGRVYFDDGTNTSDGNPRFRYFNGTDWLDLGL